MPAKPILNKLCLLCRQIFQGKWVERTLSPETPAELGFGSTVLRPGYYGLRPYTDISLDPDTGLWQEHDNLQKSNEELEADLSRSIDEFRSQGLESDPYSSDASLNFFLGEEPDILQRYKAAVKKAPIPTAKHLLGHQSIHTGRPQWIKQCQQGESGEVSFIVPIHHTPQSLKQSSEDGCHLCSMLYDNLCNRELKVDAARLERAIGVAQRTVDEQNDTICSLKFSYFVNGTFDRASAYVTGAAFDVLRKEQDDVGPYSPLVRISRPGPVIDEEESDKSPHIGSAVQGSRTTRSTLYGMKIWISVCHQKHVRCSGVRYNLKTMPGQRRLPIRLLNLLPECGLDFVTLMDSSSLDHSVDYMTLSHCWGRSLPTRLLLDNRKDFEQGIRVVNLPLTFQHAIDFARLMKCQYLWIDALCIIQDSKEDWLSESAAMSTVYSNTLLNLAATSSRDGSGGLYYPQNLHLSTPLVVQSSGSHYIISDSTAWQRRIEDGPLNHRAWVQQERFLAPRVVHFSYDQIWWQCLEAKASEAFPFGLPFDLKIKDEEAESHNIPADIVHPEWLRWVEGYTKTDITKDSDRLVATVGIANSFTNPLDPHRSVYLAGLWWQDLVVSLLWHSTESPTKLDPSVAPSWSWASVKGEIMFDCGNMDSRNPAFLPPGYTDPDPTAYISDEHLAISILDSYDPKGSLNPSQGGFIRIRAPLYRLTLSGTCQRPKDGHIQFERTRVGAYETPSPLCFFDTNHLDDESWYHASDWSDRRTYFCRFLPKLSLPGDAGSEPDAPGYAAEVKPTGLILEPTGQRGQYLRIGWLQTHTDDARSKLEKHEFLEDMDDGTYVIDLV